MKAEIITIGDEILRGSTENTNFGIISKFLSQLGIHVIQHTTIGDSVPAICGSLEGAITRADIIITTGGLGPTRDDVTRQALAEFLGVKLIKDGELMDEIQEQIPESWGKHFRECQVFGLIPQGAEWLKNPVGVAPGIYVKKGKKLIFCLPGVPVEMEIILDEAVHKVLQNHKLERDVFSQTFRTIGIPEVVIHREIDEFIPVLGVEVAYYPSFRGVDLVISARKTHKNEASKLVDRIEKLLGLHLYTKSKLTLEDIIGEILIKDHKSISTTESCTGGMLASTLINVPGASKFFPLGVVAYSYEAKMKELGVKSEELEKYGAVSKEVVSTMATGIRKKSRTDYALALSGVAGPGGGTKEKPVGLVYIALTSKDRVHIRKYNFMGTRNVIRERATASALFMLWLELNKALDEFEFKDGSKKV